MLSTDYEHLWDLIQSGERIAGWVDYDNGIRDIVEIKTFRDTDQYMIGSRGISYVTGHEKDHFITDCKLNRLSYLDPYQHAKEMAVGFYVYTQLETVKTLNYDPDTYVQAFKMDADAAYDQYIKDLNQEKEG